MSTSYKEKSSRNLNYKNSGVDIDAGNNFVKQIKPLADKTRVKGTMNSIGGFGSIFDLKSSGYVDPILVAATDGVGTKLLVAQEMNYHGTVGIDLVAMCVNDLIVQGAKPLFFLDYIATNKLNVDQAVSVVEGIVKGCKLAECSLVGGETAEMPGMYKKDDYDLAGFAIGAVERKNLIKSEIINNGDIIIGLESDGLHSNGFSLVRKIIKNLNLNYEAPSPFRKNCTLGLSLLAPTRIYVKACLNALNKNLIKGLAHITGGGLIENIPRVLPNNKSVIIDAKSWKKQSVFSWIKNTSEIDNIEMLRTFNCGIGMIAIVSPENLSETISVFKEDGERPVCIGHVTENVNSPKVNFLNLDFKWNDLN